MSMNVERPPEGDLSTPCCVAGYTKTRYRPTVQRNRGPWLLVQKYSGPPVRSVKEMRRNVKER
jgi:hypothetical protein